MDQSSSSKVWPIGIGLSIAAVFGMSVATVIITGQANIQKSDAYMTYYQEADAKANDFIEKRIAFNKKYKIEYINNGISQNGSDVSFKVVTKDNKAVNNAKVIISISRPETDKFNKKYESLVIKDGVYTFKDVKFPKAGIWNIIAKVEVGQDSRFLNLKVDTRNKKIKYFD